MNRIDMEHQPKLSSVLNALSQSVVILNAEGCIVHFNDPAEKLINRISPLKLELGRFIMDYLMDSRESLLKSEIEGVLKGHANIFELNIDLTGHGDTQWFELSFMPIVEEDLLIGASLMFRSIETRKQTELKMRHQLNFEQLIASLSSRFITISDIEQAIDSSLEEMGRFSNSSRAYIFEFSADKTHMDNTFEWCQAGVNPQILELKGLPVDIFPWWMAKLEKREIIDIKDVKLLPLEASAEKTILDQQDIKSVLVLPILIKQELRGFIGFDKLDSIGNWNPEDVTLLKLTSEIFSHAFERRLAEEELLNYNTELEITLELLQKAQSQIIQQERLVGVGHLAAGIAHEINNPLGYILSNVDTLKQNVGVLGEVYQTYENLKKCTMSNIDVTESISNIEALRKKYYIEDVIDDLEELLSDINEGLQRVSKIVNGLRTFSRVDQGDHFSQYDLNEGIENTLMMVNNELKPSVQVETNFANIPLITCIGSQINQVLLNMILNSTYAIKTRLQEEIGNLYIETRSDQEYVYCKIQDNGGGISIDEESRIFMPFYTTKPVGVGTGLGLSIAYDIVVNKHKGSIDVDNAYGKGVTFNIKLPIVQ
ncbi:ATP-binding protein [Fusibacter sp. 3D3]|uniref:GAF domain-containing sensor histidine kinase n=1 Tax=Fusibacter sp. 3D3 TaxID=1048380 RepID=UPI000853EA9A|nr:ATP-binding protein [Fusibacter sp. 3D3]GAU79121.1 signal transduction histidine kinase [Fusibacter sp. 3D3]